MLVAQGGKGRSSSGLGAGGGRACWYLPAPNVYNVYKNLELDEYLLKPIDKTSAKTLNRLKLDHLFIIPACGAPGWPVPSSLGAHASPAPALRSAPGAREVLRVASSAALQAAWACAGNPPEAHHDRSVALSAVPSWPGDMKLTRPRTCSTCRAATSYHEAGTSCKVPGWMCGPLTGYIWILSYWNTSTSHGSFQQHVCCKANDMNSAPYIPCSWWLLNHIGCDMTRPANRTKGWKRGHLYREPLAAALAAWR